MKKLVEFIRRYINELPVDEVEDHLTMIAWTITIISLVGVVSIAWSLTLVLTL